MDGLVVIIKAALCYEVNVDEKLRLLTDRLLEMKSEQDEGLLSKYRKYCYLMEIYNKRKAEF
jgi:hypothetical protein